MDYLYSNKLPLSETFSHWTFPAKFGLVFVGSTANAPEFTPFDCSCDTRTICIVKPVLTLSVIKVLISYSYGAISKYNTDEGEPVWSALDDLFLYKVPVFVRP